MARIILCWQRLLCHMLSLVPWPATNGLLVSLSLPQCTLHLRLVSGLYLKFSSTNVGKKYLLGVCVPRGCRGPSWEHYWQFSLPTHVQLVCVLSTCYYVSGLYCSIPAAVYLDDKPCLPSSRLPIFFFGGQATPRAIKNDSGGEGACF